MSSTFQQFCRDRRGATASIFAISSLAISGMIGLSLDLNRYYHVRQSLRDALDATVLAVAAKQFSGTQAEQSDVEGLLVANWSAPAGAAAAVAGLDTSVEGEVTATATSKVATTFAAIMGLREFPVVVSAQARFGLTNVEVALALDVTGSMAGSKIDALKSASKAMVDAIYAMPSASQKVRMSIVPFGNYVNVGLGYRSASWMSVDSDRSERQCYMNRPLISKSGCTTSPYTYYQEGYGQVTTTTETCTNYEYGPEQQVCGDVQIEWSGCVGSRSAPFNQRALATAANPIPGIMNTACSSPLLRQTNNVSQLNSAIDGLTAVGETYLPSGLIWGWRTLSNETPFADSMKADPTKRPRRVLVLMTDGENTRSQDGVFHWGSDVNAADTLTEQLCVEVKKDGIEIYTIAYDVTAGATLSRLQACASSGAHFFSASTSEALVATFKKIATGIGGVRIVR